MDVNNDVQSTSMANEPSASNDLQAAAEEINEATDKIAQIMQYIVKNNTYKAAGQDLSEWVQTLPGW